jgi:peroxiredoxin
MSNNIKVMLVVLLSVLFGTSAGPSFAQYIPNAPFKVEYPAAPDFSLKDLQGKTFRLKDFKGKPVLIFFGTTWCPSCRSEIPNYKKVYATYAPRGLEVVYVNIMESAKKVTRFAEVQALPYRVLLDEKGDVANAYGVVGVPMILLVDKNGLVIKVGHSAADMPLEKILPFKK